MQFIQNIKEMVFHQMEKRHPRPEPYFRNFNDVKKILVLFESDFLERNLAIKQVVRELSDEGKTVTAWGYIDKPDITSAVLRDYRVLGRRDCNLMEIPRDYERQDIRAEHFDLLIDLNTRHLLPLRYLAMMADADLRCGKVEPQPYVHDFMVDCGENDDPIYLLEQILNFLKRTGGSGTTK